MMAVLHILFQAISHSDYIVLPNYKMYLQVLAAALLKPKTVSAGHPRTRKVKPAEAAALPQPAEKPQPGAVC